MKLTRESLAEIFEKSPHQLSETEAGAVLELMNLRVKEFKHYTLFPPKKVSFEVHYRRSYIIKVEAEGNTTSVRFSNEYINFGDGNSAMHMGGLATVRELVLILLNFFVAKLEPAYKPEVAYTEDQSEYTPEEITPIVEALNDLLFNHKKPQTAQPD